MMPRLLLPHVVARRQPLEILLHRQRLASIRAPRHCRRHTAGACGPAAKRSRSNRYETSSRETERSQAVAPTLFTIASDHLSSNAQCSQHHTTPRSQRTVDPSHGVQTNKPPRTGRNLTSRAWTIGWSARGSRRARQPQGRTRASPPRDQALPRCCRPSSRTRNAAQPCQQRRR